MRKTINSPFSVLAGLAAAALLVPQLATAQSSREHLSLDANWRFHPGDDWPDALHLENSGTGSGPAAERFADAYWRVVNLPHDWAAELPFD
jgi:beta-galactosidase